MSTPNPFGAGAPADPESWRRLRSVFDEARELDGGARADLLGRACRDDEPLRREAERLLAAHDRAAAFIEAPLCVDPGALEPECEYQGLLVGGRYRVVRKIAGAGFADVFLAGDEQLGGKPVVVKVLRQGMPSEEWRRMHFEQEMRVLARISHPGVVGVLDRGVTPDSRPFLVLEYVPGVTLRQALKGGPLPAARAARLIREIGQALGAAHREGVWHRDLKPDNIMLRDLGAGDERAVVIDFGIAAVRSGDHVTTVCAGTPHYMAPEQLVGRVSAATDVYALGLVAFEMLAGRRLLEAKSDDAKTLPEVARQELERLRPETPPAAIDLIAGSLAFEPAARPGDVRAFSEKLAALLECGRTTSPRRRMLLLAGALLALAAAFVFREGIPGRPTAPAERVLHYTVLRLGNRDLAPAARPFLLGPDVVFRSGDRLRFIFESPQDGVLHLINESLVAGRSGPVYNVLLPGGSARVTAGRELWAPAGPDDWIQFDASQGVERVWFVWAAEKVRALDRLEQFANAEHGGRVDEPEIARQLSAYLAGFGSLAVDVSADPARQRTTLRVRGPVLVYNLALAHN